MPTLLDLPQELLTLIHTHLLPDPIPFVLTCKTICIRAEPTITLHNTYRTKWRHIYRPGGEIDAFYILDSIARDPLVAEYIESLHLRDMRDNSGKIRDYRGLARDLSAMNRIIDMVVECPFLKEAGIDGSRWWDLHLALENSLSEPIIELPIATLITLLLFLPNLKELGLPRWWSIGGWERWADPSLRDDVMWMPLTLLSKMVQLARKPEMSDLKPN